MNRLNRHVITVVHLENGSVESLKNTPEMDGFLGGAAINTHLLEKYRDQTPLVLGTGPLTGGFAPASCLMTASFIKPEHGHCHVPVVIRSGPLLKFSGTDYLILLGRAASPVIVFIKNGCVTLETDPFSDEPDFFHIAKKCRSIFHEEPFLVTNLKLSHDDNDHGACTSVFGGFDRCGLSGFMALKNIRAIVPGGGRGVPYDKTDMDAGVRLSKTIKKHLPRNRTLSVLNAIPDTGKACSLVKKHFKQSHACFNCPVACISYLSFKKEPEWMETDGPAGVFIMDYEGFAAFAGKHPVHAHLFMARAQALGINPLALAAGIPENETPGRLLAGMENMPLGRRKQNPEKDPFETLVTPKFYYRFGNALPRKRFKNDGLFGSWEERVAFAMITGVCPVPLIILPALSPSDYLPFLTQDKKDEKNIRTVLKRDIQTMLAF